jgi:uncharacterized protein YecE (DUF72 family)
MPERSFGGPSVSIPDLRIGCSGFNYRHWRERFYPAGVPQRQWFSFYSSVFTTVELNVTFYRLPLPRTVDRWHDETPPDFVFALKGSRYITHVRRLQDPAQAVERFFERALHLRQKLHVVLWQFAPDFRIHLERLRAFLAILRRYPVRHAFEFRHPSWITDSVFDLCSEHHASLCMADWPEFNNDLPLTSDLIYLRRHGRGGKYDSCYSRDELAKDAARIRAWRAAGRNIFIYFNNDANGYAPRNAQELLALTR